MYFVQKVYWINGFLSKLSIIPTKWEHKKTVIIYKGEIFFTWEITWVTPRGGNHDYFQHNTLNKY